MPKKSNPSSSSFGDEIEQAIQKAADALRARFARPSSTSTSSSSTPSKYRGLKPKQAFRTKLSINDIRASAWNASNYNTESYKFLSDEYAKLAKLANSRMRSLEKEQLDMFAYDRMRVFLDNKGLRRLPSKFSSIASQSDYKTMVKVMSELVTFINAKTSTVAEARKTLDAKINKISEHTGTEYTQDQKLAMGHLLGTDSVSALLRDVRGDSGEVLELLEDISMTDFDKNRIRSIIDKYLQGYDPFSPTPTDYLNYDEMMDELRDYRDSLKQDKEGNK